jgi:uncharacterized protein YjbI with pentapeptide repeats
MANYESKHQQAELVNVLRSRRRLEDDYVGHIDLNELSLEGFSAQGSTLRNTSLIQAKLPESRWLEVLFQGVELRQASLGGALLEGCSFDQARLMHTELSGATVAATRFKQSFLTRVKLAGARIVRCQIDDCDLTAADLSGARLIHCRFVAPQQLGGANLARITAQGARFVDCDLAGVNFREADLSGATFVSCDLRGANCRDANLTQASFVACNAEGINLEQARCEGFSHAGTRFFHALTAGASF